MSPLCVCEEGIFIGAGCQLVRLTQTQNGFEQWTQERLNQSGHERCRNRLDMGG